jgi:hypothetical protein
VVAKKLAAASSNEDEVAGRYPQSDLPKTKGVKKMQELSMNEVEQVNGGFIVVVALALFDVGMIAYDAYQLKHIND